MIVSLASGICEDHCSTLKPPNIRYVASFSPSHVAHDIDRGELRFVFRSEPPREKDGEIFLLLDIDRVPEPRATLNQVGLAGKAHFREQGAGCEKGHQAKGSSLNSLTHRW